MKLEVGKKYVDGHGAIHCCVADLRGSACYTGDYPFVLARLRGGWVSTFTEDGVYQKGGSRIDNLIREVTPYDHLKRGDPVWAWDEGDIREDWMRFHFSHTDGEGRPYVFGGGRSTWTCGKYNHSKLAHVVSFDHVRIATPEELKARGYE